MDFGMVRWLEHEGYDVTYITDVDAHEDVGRLLRAKGYISPGHPEYVSNEIRAHILQARDQGVGLGFFGANYLYWPVELVPDSRGNPNRSISLAPSNQCVSADPADPNPDDPSPPFTKSDTSSISCRANSDCATGQVCKYKECDYNCQLDASGARETEQLVAGGMWDLDQAVIASDDIVVPGDAPLGHWVFANTGLSIGDTIPGLIGTEYNETSSDPAVTPPGLKILLHTSAPNYGDPGAPLVYPFDWSMTAYQSSSGAWVFNAATNQWAWGLDDYFTGLTTTDGANNGPAFRIQCGEPSFHPGLVSCRSAAIEQITRNVLNKFIRRP
jgi:hypothetical protein